MKRGYSNDKIRKQVYRAVKKYKKNEEEENTAEKKKENSLSNIENYTTIFPAMNKFN